MILSRVARKPVFGVSDTKTRAEKPQKMPRGLKFWIYKEVERLHYPCSENKGADQLRGYHAADLRL